MTPTGALKAAPTMLGADGASFGVTIREARYSPARMSAKDPFEGIAPVSIAGDAAGKRMTVTWNDGHVSELTYEWLRWHCPCASCAGEGDVPGSLATTTALTPQQTTLEDLQLVGSYGMSPVWQDGHHTGIFTFRNLRMMCPCPSCQAKREELASSV